MSAAASSTGYAAPSYDAEADLLWGFGGEPGKTNKFWHSKNVPKWLAKCTRIMVW